MITYFGIFSSLDSLYQDKLYQIPRGMNQKIKIIAIDEKTLEEYGPINTWDRSIYNSLLEKMGEYPSVIAFDIMFMGDMNEDSDEAFKETISGLDNVVVGSHLMFDTALEYDEKGKLSLKQINKPNGASEYWEYENGKQIDHEKDDDAYYDVDPDREEEVNLDDGSVITLVYKNGKLTSKVITFSDDTTKTFK